MSLAFKHAETGTIVVTDDAEGYGSPDWEALPDVPDGDGPWKWNDSWQLDPDPALLNIRTQRDMLLLACDWTQLADVPEETRANWQAYRQALRDMPEAANPFDPEWPEPPA